jgi:hypothetical protein
VQVFRPDPGDGGSACQLQSSTVKSIGFTVFSFFAPFSPFLAESGGLRRFWIVPAAQT